jgi:hypothetical protein
VAYAPEPIPAVWCRSSRILILVGKMKRAL